MLIQQVGQRFINKLTQKTSDQEVGVWLKGSPNFPDNFCSIKSDYFFRCRWPLRIDRWAQINVAEAEITNNFLPLILDIDVIQQCKQTKTTLKEFSIITEELHEEIFENSITLNYKKILNAN